MIDKISLRKRRKTKRKERRTGNEAIQMTLRGMNSSSIRMKRSSSKSGTTSQRIL